MSNEDEIICSGCGKSQDDAFEWKCRSCGGAFSLRIHKPFRKDLVKKDVWNLWRYKAFLTNEKSDQISLGEGCTPLVYLGETGVSAKLDYVMPTGSYKDRGSTLMVSSILEIAKRSLVKKVTEDSSGNAGASIAAYTAAAGIGCEVFAPDRVVIQKAKQIEAYGAKLTRVDGTREMLSECAIKAAEEGIYLSHIWNPYFLDGIRTLAYEIAEALLWDVPDYVFLPVSAGTLLLGVIRGFSHLLSSDVTDKMPKIVACQTSEVSPVYNTLYGKEYFPPTQVSGIADALVSTRPVRLQEMVYELKKYRGEAEVVNDDEIRTSTILLSSRGLFVEPSAAVSYAAWRKRASKGEVDEQSKVIVILTGSGLKTLNYKHTSSY